VRIAQVAVNVPRDDDTVTSLWRGHARDVRTISRVDSSWYIFDSIEKKKDRVEEEGLELFQAACSAGF